MRVVQRRTVGTLLVSRDNQVVLGYKDPNLGGRYSGCWVVPGGGVEDGETGTEALYREIKEELGVDISVYDFVLVDDSLTGENETFHKITKEPVCYKMYFLDYIRKFRLMPQNSRLLRRMTWQMLNGYHLMSCLGTGFRLRQPSF